MAVMKEVRRRRRAAKEEVEGMCADVVVRCGTIKNDQDQVECIEKAECCKDLYNAVQVSGQFMKEDVDEAKKCLAGAGLAGGEKHVHWEDMSTMSTDATSLVDSSSTGSTVESSSNLVGGAVFEAADADALTMSTGDSVGSVGSEASNESSASFDKVYAPVKTLKGGVSPDRILRMRNSNMSNVYSLSPRGPVKSPVLKRKHKKKKKEKKLSPKKQRQMEKQSGLRPLHDRLFGNVRFMRGGGDDASVTTAYSEVGEHNFARIIKEQASR